MEPPDPPMMISRESRSLPVLMLARGDITHTFDVLLALPSQPNLRMSYMTLRAPAIWRIESGPWMWPMVEPSRGARV